MQLTSQHSAATSGSRAGADPAASGTTASRTARVLVIDDDPTSRLKMTAAARALGYDVRAVASGREGLEVLAETPVDLVLLDLMMPEIDGFEVLRRRAADPDLSRVPVLVISGVDDVIEIAEAIELGAEDVLPKSFDPVLLRARMGAAIERHRLHQAEAEDIERLQRLAAAAQIIEETKYDPNRLGLGEMTRDGDDLGRLARVFLRMAEEVHKREVALRARVGLLVGMLLLVAFGALQGLQPVLSRVLSDSPFTHLGAAACTFLVGATAMLGAAMFTGPWSLPSRGRLAALLGYAVVSLAVPRLLMLNVAEVMSAQGIALLISGQALIVFMLAVLIGIEVRSIRRFAGLLVGFGGIAFVIFAPGAGTIAEVGLGAILLTLTIPLGYAAGVVLLALCPARSTDNLVLHAGIAIAAAGAGLSAVAVAGGAMPTVADVSWQHGLPLIGFGIAGASATLVAIFMVRVTGPVFASQSGYAATAGGILWSVVLLGEPFGWRTAAALLVLTIGMALVMPRRDEPDLDTLVAGNSRLSDARMRLRL